MSRYAFFVAGTDTGVGKTLVTAALLQAAAERGWSAAGVKPVAAGCDEQDGMAVNDDALCLQSASTVPLTYEQVNPVALWRPIAPHVAAAEQGLVLDAETLRAHCQSVATLADDLLVVEGAGGWLVPLNADETLADVCRLLDIPVLLVVGMKLGCINHALLTARAIVESGVALAGWVANCIDPDMAAVDENIAALRQRLPAAYLGRIEHLGERLDAAVDSGLINTAWLFDESTH